jgi:hypothetical protein
MASVAKLQLATYTKCTKCPSCDPSLTKKSKVRHHATSLFISTLCNNCNLQYKPLILPVVFHQLKETLHVVENQGKRTNDNTRELIIIYTHTELDVSREMSSIIECLNWKNLFLVTLK